MTKSSALDPFVVFGIEHRLDHDAKVLERRYLELSRRSHPDHHRARGADDCAAVLARSAEINDAWRALKDRWRRAQALLELRAPAALEQQKQLDEEFLLDAMELAEEVATAEPEAVPALAERLRQREDQAWQAVQAAVAQGDLELAARRLHESKYVRKARADLELRDEVHA